VRCALTIAAPRNYVRVFIDNGRELGARIARLAMEQWRGSGNAAGSDQGRCALSLMRPV